MLLSNNNYADEGMGAIFGPSFSVQAIQIRSHASQLNEMYLHNSVKLKQNIALNQKSNNHQSSQTNNNDAFAQSSFGKMVSGTDTNEQGKQSSLSQETIDAAAQVTTDEATAELTRAFGQSAGTTRLGGTSQERNLISSLDSLEEGSLESTLEETAGMTKEQEKTKSAVDATLEEIQRLHIIEQELAKAQIGTAETAHQKNKEINQNKIEAETLSKLKSEQAGKAGHKDKIRVEELVQQQIEEQANAIEDSQTFEQNADVLNYGNYIDNKDFTSTGELEDQQLQEDIKEFEREDAEKAKQEKELKEKQQQAKQLEMTKGKLFQDADIDETNQIHLQSQAALGDISPTQVKGQAMIKVVKEPLQPSADASKLDLSGDLPFSSKKTNKRHKSQKQQIAEVVKRSIALHKQTEKKDQKKIEAAEALFKFKQEHAKPFQNINQQVAESSIKIQKSEKAKKMGKDPVTKVDEKKEKILAQKNRTKTKKKTAGSTTTDERDHEILQLDNLFLTVREQLVSKVGEAKKSKAHKKTKKKSKHLKKKAKKQAEKTLETSKAPEGFSLLQLDASMHTSENQMNRANARSSQLSRNTQKNRLKSHMHSRNKLQQRRASDEVNLSIDESADLELQELAHSEIKMNLKMQNAGKSEADDCGTSTDSSGSSAGTIEVKDVTESEVEGSSTSANKDKAESKEEADYALKRQERLEKIVEERSDHSSLGQHKAKTDKPAYDHDASLQDVSIGDLMGEADADDAIKDSNREESERVVAQQQRKEKEIQEASGEDGRNGGSVKDHDRVLKSTINDIQTEALLTTAEADAAENDNDQIAAQRNDRELIEASGDDYRNGGTNYEHDAALKSAINDIQVDVMLKKAEARHSQDCQDQEPALGDSAGDKAAKSLLEESVFEGHMKHGPPASSSLLQVGSSVEVEAESQVEAEAEIQAEAMTEIRAEASAQAKAATEALAALGVQQKSQIKTQDQNLIDALKRTIGQLEAKQNPAAAAAAAKKKAVNNIQKALTNKILTRLDDSQPLVNVFSKMQSLSKMMPQIQDFERRLGILHQVEPILENAISTLSKVVDLTGPLPALPVVAPAPAPPPPPPPKPAQPDLNQLKVLLAQAQQQQAPAPAPEADDLSALLGGVQGDSAIGNLLGGSGGGLGGLESLLGGAAAAPEPAPQLEAPAFLQASAAAVPAADPLAALGGLQTALSGSDESALLSKLLGSRL